jgi:hypothetical protein
MEEQELDRLEKLKKYYDHPLFNIQKKYGWSFKEFAEKVDSGAFAKIQEGIQTVYNKRAM